MEKYETEKMKPRHICFTDETVGQIIKEGKRRGIKFSAMVRVLCAERLAEIERE